MAIRRKARKRMAARKSSTKTRSARAKASSKNGRVPDAIALLRSDHETVKGLFEAFEKSRGEKRKAALAGKICDEVTIHARIEEEIFYPAAREVLQKEDLVDEAAVEHSSARWLIEQIRDARPGDDRFDAKVKVLGEYIDHHVKEEQNEMFPKIRKTGLDLKELGERMHARKRELQR